VLQHRASTNWKGAVGGGGGCSEKKSSTNHTQLEEWEIKGEKEGKR